jgi:hypothetical protein
MHYAAARWLLVTLCVALAACTRAVDGDPTPGPPGPAASDLIQPAQLVDLLTPSESLAVVPGIPLAEHDLQSILFVGAAPSQCHGVVGFGHYPLFPTNYTGREARTQVDNAADRHQLLEASATYPSDFDAAHFLDSVRKTVSDCQHTVIAWGDDERKRTVKPASLIPGSVDVAHWTTNLSDSQWICDFAIIAKANVVSQIETCSADRSLEIQPLITKRLKEIEDLLKSTV